MKELDKVLNQNEKVLWEGKPSFWPFFLSSSIYPFIFGLVWMFFLIPFIYGLSFLILFVPHFWIGIVLIVGVPIYQLLVFRHICYAITDKRVILQKGLIGRDFEIVDFDQITNAEVNVGLIDKLFGGKTGSILISTAGSFTYTRRGITQRPYTLRHIENPYDVFKFFKKVSYDVKTDIEYPNKFRPQENPGYQTDYKPEGFDHQVGHKIDEK